MTDLALNSDFDVFLDHRNDVETVDGKEEFEQDVSIQLTDKFYDDTGEYDIGILEQKIKYQVNLVAQQNEFLDNVDKIDVERSLDNPNKLNVVIRYSSSDSFSTLI